MASSPLPSSLRMGCVSLNVQDIEEVTEFYQAAGLGILKKGKNSLILGYGKREILSLAKTNLPRAPQNGAGLYHVAIVHASQEELAKSIKNLFEKFPDNFTGPADHLVSEAFYFSDPEGNGLELYYDRPRSTWQWVNGKIVMDTKYLDPLQYIKHADGKGSKEKHVGHVHLKVGDIEKAKEFYVDVLGFEITADSWPGALFISAGKYHHHIGLNIWHSRGAGKRKEELGLSDFEIIIPKAAIESLKKRLEDKNLQFKREKSKIIINDQWNNTILFKG